MTCREKLAIEQPECIDASCEGGCRGCPDLYGYLDRPKYCAHGRYGNDKNCTNCWDREIPDKVYEEKENKPMRKTKAMLEEELKQKSTEIEDLKKELEKVETYKKYEDAAGELKAIYDSFVNAGFNENQAFTLMTLIIQNQNNTTSRSSRISYRSYDNR